MSEKEDTGEREESKVAWAGLTQNTHTEGAPSGDKCHTAMRASRKQNGK